MLSVHIFNRETEDHTYKNFTDRVTLEEFFRDSYFLYEAEINIRGNLLPIGGKRARDSYVEWYDE